MGISPLQIAIIVVIALLLFGGKRIRSLATEMGGAIKGFKDSIAEDGNEKERVEAKASVSEAGKDADFVDR